jgi:SnoaL-like domain
MARASLAQELHSRAALAPVFDDLNKYAATMHFVGQSTVLSLTGDRATGEAYTLAHHLTVDGAKRGLMIAALRYADVFVERGGYVAVCGTPALRRLERGARAVVTPRGHSRSPSGRQHPRWRERVLPDQDGHP